MPCSIVAFLYLSICLQVVQGQASNATQFDLRGYPPADIPPPPNTAWNSFFNISRIPSSAALKNPPNSDIYPACPNRLDGQNYCDWSCWNCTRSSDIESCGQRQWALTFDDGPSNNTLQILQALDAANVKATFCIVGSRVLSRPDILLRIHSRGHQLCSHTWSHRYLTTQTNEQIVAEFEWTSQIIQDVTGVRPVLARPPFGDIDDRVRSVLAALRYRVLLWNRDTKDWNLNSPASNFSAAWIQANFTQWAREINATRQGLISLEHDLYVASAAEAPRAIRIAASANASLVTIAQCTNGSMYVANSSSSSFPPKQRYVTPSSMIPPLPSPTAGVSSFSGPGLSDMTFDPNNVTTGSAISHNHLTLSVIGAIFTSILLL